MKNLSRVSLAFLFVVSAVGLKADVIAYAGSSDGDFGFIDLNTGAFSSLGNSGQTLAGLAVANGTIFASSYHTADGTLFEVSPTNGSLTTIGAAAGVDFDDFGSTTSGLYVVSFGATQDLYSINPTTGAATLIGPTGLGYGSWRSLSTNSSALYFADGPDLYTLNVNTGAATLVGAFGSNAEMGAMLTEDGILWGGDNTNGKVDTIDTTTGTATLGAAPSGLSGTFFGLAPYPVPTGAVPEPGYLGLLGAGITALAVFRRRLQ